MRQKPYNLISVSKPRVCYKLDSNLGGVRLYKSVSKTLFSFFKIFITLISDSGPTLLNLKSYMYESQLDNFLKT